MLACLIGVGLSGALLWLLLITLLEPWLLDERALRTNRNVRLVEKVLESLPAEQLPDGVIIHRGPAGPEHDGHLPGHADVSLMTLLAQRYGLRREILGDDPPLTDPWGGFWIRLQTPRLAGPTLWLYQPERLASNLWFLPLLRSLAVVIGLSGGSVLFLRRRVEAPLGRMLDRLDSDSRPPLPLLPEQGVAPLRVLTFRINRLLESINDTERARTSLLRGVAHDLTSPQTRLTLRLESLRESLGEREAASFEAIENDLRQLSQITAQLGLLADASRERPRRHPIGLDDLCARVAGSYPAGSVHLQVPRLLVVVDAPGLERSLCNLIDNALEYGRPPVEISARRQKNQLLLRVEDRGQGLMTPTLLTMTSPPPSTDRQRQRHRGLGLAIVEQFCRDHGGRLRLEPSALGGLCATLQLSAQEGQALFI